MTRRAGRFRFAVLLGCALSVAVAGMARGREPRTVSGAADELRPVAVFARIADPDARSVALFREMGKVIQSPRCLNCHPRTDSPTQTDALRPHRPQVVRGPDGHGAPALECGTCHGRDTVELAGGGSIPGDPQWHLAPASMAWQGKTLGDICRQMKDPARNHHMTLDDLIRHNGEDHLVGWAWHPGSGRKPAPGTQAQFGALTAAWVGSGAKCPR